MYRKLRKIQENFNSRLRKETNLLPLLLQLVDFAFQFTSPQGDERGRSQQNLGHRRFQLTSPQGDEHFSSFNLLRIVYFNSRLREGTNTFFQVFFKRTFSITTHIPTRRRTDGIVASIAAPSFQITSPFGDELQILVLGTYSSYFNSHPRKETNIKFHCHLR